MAKKIDKNGDNFTCCQGNLYFYPPEFCDGKEKQTYQLKPVDIWAFGITLYTCIYKCLPFLPENPNNVMLLFQMISEAK